MVSVKVAKVSDVPPGTKKSIRASKTRVLVANVGGKFYAMQSVCTHHANPLFEGKLEGKVLTCSAHYAKFDVTTGAVVAPAEGSEWMKLDQLNMYPVRVEGDDLIVEVPE
jgi:nitrite reductase/ring-hydroxylating ferredoxin subunit